MTNEQLQAIQKAKNILSLAFPGFHGSIKINLNPKVKDKKLKASAELDLGSGVISKETVLVNN